ncbi:hypothetical protein Dsin_032719, partial [Dipteronia sinensis]
TDDEYSNKDTSAQVAPVVKPEVIVIPTDEESEEEIIVTIVKLIDYFNSTIFSHKSYL